MKNDGDGKKAIPIRFHRVALSMFKPMSIKPNYSDIACLYDKDGRSIRRMCEGKGESERASYRRWKNARKGALRNRMAQPKWRVYRPFSFG